MMTRRGFTLIELMIVVGIFAFLSAILVPNLLRARAAALRADTAEDRPAPMASPVETPVVLPTPTEPLAVVHSVLADIRLTAAHRLVGDEVYTHYLADCHERWLLESPSQGPVAVVVRFPPGTTEARDVSLRFESPSGLSEPNGVRYGPGGLTWQGDLPQGVVTADITFTALGHDRFEYSLPPSSRIDTVDLAVTLDGIDRGTITIPDQSFQPTATEPHRLEWHYSNLVTDRSVLIELPGGQTPLGHLMLLLHLVGFAVLLFGAGFWYLAELQRPGFLEGFRWGHFLLLATTYSLFFVIFAVLGLHDEIAVSTAGLISAIVSLPLLLLHVSRVLDARFALTRTLPLALFTLGVVLTGVYGGGLRDYLFVAEGCVVIGFVTVTWRGWSARRETWQRARDAERHRQQVAQVVERRQQDVRKLLAPIEQPADLESLVTSTEPRTESYHRVEKARKQYAAALARRDQLVASLSDPSVPLSDDQKARAEALNTDVQAATAELHAAREAHNTQPTIVSDLAAPHCMACGESATPSIFCPHCGQRQAWHPQCDRCGTRYALPAHLLSSLPGARSLHCAACGDQLGL